MKVAALLGLGALLIILYLLSQMTQNQDLPLKETPIELNTHRQMDLDIQALNDLGLDSKLNSDHWLLITFWAHWCLPCHQELPTLEAIYDELQAIGVDVLIVNMDAPDSAHYQLAREFWKNANFRLPHLWNPDMNLFDELKIEALPQHFLIQPESILRWEAVGAYNWSHPTVLNSFIQAIHSL